MVTIRLRGGLGNQMFQYAFGRSLTLKSGDILALDLDEFTWVNSKFTKRKYELLNFNLPDTILTGNYYRFSALTKTETIYRPLRKILKKFPRNPLGILIEQTNNYNNNLINYPDRVYYDGYWQSYKYFEEFREKICHEFTPKILSNDDCSFIKKIQKINSVAVHIRRGDYVTNIHANRNNGLCALNYYYEAVNHILSKYSDLHFFLFSDDVKWVAENFKIDAPFSVVDSNGENKAFMDIYLMSKCSHHIIANSSFSWWGAWLSESKDKTVIAPKKWFNIKRETEDLLPKKWVQF